MKTLKPLLLNLLCLFPMVGRIIADEPLVTANSAAHDAIHEYNSTIDQMIVGAIDNGPGAIQANNVAMARALEYEILADARLHVIKGSELPALVFAQGPPIELRNLPGRVLELRLLRAGINPLQDGLTNKGIQYRIDASADSGLVGFDVPVATNTFPKIVDFVAEYAYASYLIGRREWADAIRHLDAAANVPGGTTTGVWEFEIRITKSWAQAMNGDFSAARTTLRTALAEPHECEVSPRARVLERLFGGEMPLAPEVQAALPERK
jgi:hypothetical protein